MQLLKLAGYEARPSSQEEDEIHKVDFWVKVPRGEQWVAVQFSLDHGNMVSEKGRDALRRCIVPSCLNGQDLELAVSGNVELRTRLVLRFWEQVQATLGVYPHFAVRRPAVEALQMAVQAGRVSRSGLRP